MDHVSEKEVNRPLPDTEGVLTGDQDNEQLARLGHKQELKRNFSLVSMLALAVSLMATWEAFCSTMAAGLVSGGPVSLVYGFIVAFFGTLATAMSLAEAASMFPTAGGQYHFVAELAPKRLRSISSWFAGWISVFGWQSVAASAPFLAGTMIQGLLVLNYETYVFKRWHGTLLYWAVLVLACAVNIFGSKIFPQVENLTLVLHVVFFIVILVVVCAVSPTKHTASFVFTDFENETGWSSSGVAWSVGMLSSCYVLIAYDGAIHLSEEMHNPATGVPFAMVGSIVINGILGFAFLLGVLFCMGDIASALATPTGYPIIQIFSNITGSNRAASAMTSAIIVIACLSTVPLVASAARTMWAFARDDAMPFSGFLSKVDEKWQVPANSILVTTIFLGLLGLINIGSTTAFNAILSLAVVGLQVSYFMPVGLLLWRRLTAKEHLQYGPWKLGRFGVPINVVSIIYLTYTCVFLLFPPYQPVTAVNMNYSSLVLGAVLLYSLFFWFWKGRKTYVGPAVEFVGLHADDSDLGAK